MAWKRIAVAMLVGCCAASLVPSTAAAKQRHKASAKSKAHTAARHATPAIRKVSHAVPERRSGALDLRSNVALVIDSRTGEAVVAKNIHDVQPIASITKLMTALVVTDSGARLDERITITEEDVDTERGSRSRLKVGTEFSRGELLHLALMASENRAAHALGRSHPGGLPAFTAAMNEKARTLGMGSTRFVDPTGLSSSNVSTAADLVRLVHAAHAVPLIRQYSTDTAFDVNVAGRETRFHNTNRLVASDGWDIGLSKTGFINEAGRCLVMHARVSGRQLTFVLLDSWGKLSRIGDANRIRKWLTTTAVTPRSV
jgi:D-alanyl-D-alanine endopeptidase (penicillin-binding protein 7)